MFGFCWRPITGREIGGAGEMARWSSSRGSPQAESRLVPWEDGPQEGRPGGGGGEGEEELPPLPVQVGAQ